MTPPADLSDTGLPGWRATVHADPEAQGRKVCVLVSPDFNPIRQTGRMITRRGRDEADAFAQALEAARGSLQ